MLVDIASILTKLTKLLVVFNVGNDVDGQLPTHFEPLRSFPPLLNSDLWCHAGVVSAPSERPRIVKHADKALVGVHEIVVRECEVPNRSATLRKKDKALIVEIKECVC